MKFLVTGGAGFLGTAVSNQLAKDGHAVHVLDDLSNDTTFAGLHPSVTFTKGSVNDIPLLWSLLYDVDCVYHLAARVSVPESLLHPREYSQVNVVGTVSLMEAMRDSGVRRVVFTSSGAVYGRQSDQPVHESDDPIPDSPYAVSKWAAEQYIHTIGDLWHMETVALRIFNAYGPGQSLPAAHAPVVPRYLRQALNGGSIVIYGDGTQSRDFVYISDVVAALVSAATATGVNRQVINVGSGVETAVNDLIACIEMVNGRSVNRIHNTEKSGGVTRLVADISRARALLGYRPLISLKKGIKLTLKQDERFR
jgi:UDP-glucose 4-epimerase